MRYTKPALTYEEQLRLVESRGLSVADRAAAIHWLKKVGYYRLSAYFLPFKIRKSDLFSPGSSIEKVVALYQFDARLRLLVMQAIDLVEIAVRASVTYHFAHIAGPFGHMDPKQFCSLRAISRAGYPRPRFRSHGLQKALRARDRAVCGGLRWALQSEVLSGTAPSYLDGYRTHDPGDAFQDDGIHKKVPA